MEESAAGSGVYFNILLSVLIPVISGIVILVFRTRSVVFQQNEDRKAEINKLRLKVAEDYVHRDDLASVEARILNSINEVKDEIRELRREEINQLKQLTARCGPAKPK